MKHLLAPPVVLVPLVVLACFSFASVRSFAGQEPDPVQAWEYQVVGLTEIYGNTLDYLKDALGGDKKSLLDLARKTDEQLVAKTRDLLNEYGEAGWELAEYRENVLIFKRPVR